MADHIETGYGGTRLPPPLAGLEELSGNLWWSWDAEATALWDEAARILRAAPRDWSPRNPVRLLRRASGDALSRLASDRAFRAALARVLARFRRHVGPRRPPPALRKLSGPVAYFSMEFAVHESLPIYAGGLGILAGDHVK